MRSFTEGYFHFYISFVQGNELKTRQKSVNRKAKMREIITSWQKKSKHQPNAA